MDWANLVISFLSLLVTAAIGLLAYRLQRASTERERRAERREFAASVDAWARVAEQELVSEPAQPEGPYLRKALESDRRTVAGMRPEFLIDHVERALARIAEVPPPQRAIFVESVRRMRDWNVRRWIVDPETTEENEAFFATGALSRTGSLADGGQAATTVDFSGEGGLQ